MSELASKKDLEEYCDAFILRHRAILRPDLDYPVR